MWWIVFLLIIILVTNKRIDSYQNYLDIPIYDCNDYHKQKILNLSKYKRTLHPFGYSSNEYIDKTRFIFTKEPLPTNPDFFMY